MLSENQGLSVKQIHRLYQDANQGLNVKLLMAHLWIVLYTKSISYVRGFTSEIYHFFQYRKRISTAYRDSLVPPNEDICILSFHISRFITFSFSKRISHRYAVLFPRIFFSFFFFFTHFLLFPFFFFFFFFSVEHTLNSSCDLSNVIGRINGNNIDITPIIYCAWKSITINNDWKNFNPSYKFKSLWNNCATVLWLINLVKKKIHIKKKVTMKYYFKSWNSEKIKIKQLFCTINEW